MKKIFSLFLFLLFLSTPLNLTLEGTNSGYRIGYTYHYFTQGNVSVYFQQILTNDGAFYGGYIYLYNNNPYPITATLHFHNPQNASANLASSATLAKKGASGFIHYMGYVVRPNLNANWSWQMSLDTVGYNIPRGGS